MVFVLMQILYLKQWVLYLFSKLVKLLVKIFLKYLLVDLPINAKNYVSELGKFIETKISSISTSPERNDTILIEDPFNN